MCVRWTQSCPRTGGALRAEFNLAPSADALKSPVSTQSLRPRPPGKRHRPREVVKGRTISSPSAPWMDLAHADGSGSSPTVSLTAHGLLLAAQASRGSEQYQPMNSVIAWSYVRWPLAEVRLLRTAPWPAQGRAAPRLASVTSSHGTSIGIWAWTTASRPLPASFADTSPAAGAHRSGRSARPHDSCDRRYRGATSRPMSRAPLPRGCSHQQDKPPVTIDTRRSDDDRLTNLQIETSVNQELR